MLGKKRIKKDEESTRKRRQFVGFQIGGELYGIDIHSIQEIDRMHAVTKLPKSLPFIEGVINLRRRIIPVIDMAKRFGLPAIEEGRRTRIIIVRLSGQAVGLIVENVSDVIPLDDESIEPAPAMAFAVDHKYVEGVGRVDDGLIILLNMDLLLSGEEMSLLQQHPLS